LNIKESNSTVRIGPGHHYSTGQLKNSDRAGACTTARAHGPNLIAAATLPRSQLHPPLHVQLTAPPPRRQCPTASCGYKRSAPPSGVIPIFFHDTTPHHRARSAPCRRCVHEPLKTITQVHHLATPSQPRRKERRPREGAKRRSRRCVPYRHEHLLSIGLL
jgi:hypothetical protein